MVNSFKTEPTPDDLDSTRLLDAFRLIYQNVHYPVRARGRRRSTGCRVPSIIFISCGNSGLHYCSFHRNRFYKMLNFFYNTWKVKRDCEPHKEGGLRRLGFSQLRTSHRCVAGLFDRNRISDGGGVGRLRRSGAPELSLTARNSTAKAVT
ncbi:hypothetical protein EVAR_29298_1 [Eumeta japonica]|uniref:Uncharacterized protein n=1 Tax=Eumeta variegata TaxID=151549 RepID=A0A4C1VXD9_EUMVA|nr:hypothetical protein EVAR_29298_1 [Eumeta japonica]